METEEITNPSQGTEETASAAVAAKTDTTSTENNEQAPNPQERTFENITEIPQDTKDISKILTDRGFDYGQLQSEYEQFGDITAETREALAKKGISGAALDSAIEQRKAEVQKQMNTIVESIGGQEQYSAIINWAKANLSDEEKREIDDIHNPYALQVILRDLKNRMEAVDGYIPESITGSGGVPQADVFHSMAEVQAAISDPRYDVDEHYRDMIGQKITDSLHAGYINF